MEIEVYIMVSRSRVIVNAPVTWDVTFTWATARARAPAGIVGGGGATAVSPGLKALSKNMLNRKMVFRVTKSQSMKDKLSFI